jgi:hypothetical protein
VKLLSTTTPPNLVGANTAQVNEGSAQAIVIAVGSNSQSGVISLLAGQGATSSSGEESGDGMRSPLPRPSKCVVITALFTHHPVATMRCQCPVQSGPMASALS